MSVDLRLGDCLEILPTLPAGSVDAVITDPPYGIGWNTAYDFDLHNSSAPYAKNMARKRHKPIEGDNKPFDPSPLLRQFENLIIWGAQCFPEKLGRGSLLIWDKRDLTDRAYFSEAEAAWMSKGQSVRIFKHCWQGFSRASENSQHYHPTQKPVVLMQWCIELISKPGDTILDPFMGSGTTGVACVQLNRNFIGIEIDETYYRIAEKRIREAQLQMVMPLETL